MSTSTNLFARFKKLFDGPPLLVGTVVQSETGFCVIDMPGGGILRVLGDAALNSKVFVRNGVIEGTAPSLTASIIEI